MPASNMLPMLATIFVVWAVGVFLVSPRHDQTVRREIRIGGGILIGLSLLLLALFFGTRPGSWPKPQLGLDDPRLNWWPESELQDAISAIAFFVFAAGSIVSAMFAIFAGEPKRSLRWFALMLAFGSGLLAFHDAMFPAGIGLAVAGAVFGFVTRNSAATVSAEHAQASSQTGYHRTAGRDPGLTSLAGSLIAASLVGVVSYALVHESGAAGMRSGRSRLTVGFPSAAKIASGSTSSKTNRQPAIDGGNLLIRRYWILPAALSALVVCAFAGFVLIRRRNIMQESDAISSSSIGGRT